MMCRLRVLWSQPRNFLWVASILLLCFEECLSLNNEGLALLEFRSKVDVDPHGVFRSWDAEDQDPCSWVGVHCIDGKVDALNLKELSLGGTLAPELGKLSHLRYLILYKNHFYGDIPKDIGQLTMLELLDVRGNSLSGSVPIEITEMISLGHLLLCDDKFQSSNPLIELKCDQDHSSSMVMDIECTNRKFKYCIQQNPLQQLEKDNSFVIPIKAKVLNFLDMLPWLEVRRFFLSHGHVEEHGVNILNSQPHTEQNMQLAQSSARRKLLQESSNLPAVPVSISPPIEAVSVPTFGSGAFPAVPNSNNGKSSPISPKDSSSDSHAAINDPDSSAETTAEENENSLGLTEIIVLVLPGAAIVLVLIAGTVMCLRQKGPEMVVPANTGLSGPLQKVFVEGVTKLNKAELEAACEDFSNIISTFPFCTVYKGTLSSGVEIAVVSTSVASADWSKRSEAHFRKKVDTLSRISHKNFVNLLGYCEENEPFMRMVVLEYALTGTLYEHLHEKEYEHLDWSTRMRIIMGTAYCLQYLLEELNPPVVLGDLHSRNIYLTDDYAAKVFDRNMWAEIAERRNKSGEEDNDPSESPSLDRGSNIHNFGIIMLETISGRVHSQGDPILHWAADYLNDKSNFKNLADPTLKSLKDEELEVVCEAIQECIKGDTKDKSEIKLIVGKLRQGLGISPEAACPRLSPLWWAELEILSVEAS